MKLFPAVFAAIMISLTGCIRDNRDDCTFPLRLHFTYLYNEEATDLLSDEVETLRLYLYDTATGAIVASRSLQVSDLDASNSTEWLVPPGKFSLVTWGGVKNRYDVNPGNTLDAMTLTLPADASTGKVTHEQEHLWHNLTTDLLVNGDITPVYDIDMHKLSNDVTVTVATPEGYSLPLHPVSEIAATNGVYDAYGNIPEGSAPISYIPAVEAMSRAGELPGSVHSYTTLGLERDDDSALKVDLDGTTIYDGSLTALIGAQPDIDFDLMDEFNVYFLVTPGNDRLDVAVSVNGWQVVEYDVTLR